MAKFEVSEREGMRWVDVHIQHEMVRVESGALSYLIGDIAIHSKLIPSFVGMVSSLMADESVYRPTYTGTGIITLESSLGGFHVFRLRGESWILERGAYWASEGAIEVKFHRERTSVGGRRFGLFANEGHRLWAARPDDSRPRRRDYSSARPGIRRRRELRGLSNRRSGIRHS